MLVVVQSLKDDDAVLPTAYNEWQPAYGDGGVACIRRVNASRSTRTLWMRLPGYAAQRQGWQDNDNGWRPMGMQLQEGTERKRGRRRRSRTRPTDKCALCLTFADAFSRTWTGTDRLAPRLALALLLPRHRQSQSGGGAPRRPPHFVLLSSPRAPLDVSLSKDAGWLHQERHFWGGLQILRKKEPVLTQVTQILPVSEKATTRQPTNRGFQATALIGSERHTLARNLPCR